MKKINHLLPLAAILLAGCATPGGTSSEISSATSENVTWLTPTGAPTLAFYDQGANANWVSTSVSTDIPAAFASESYDAIVFDGVSGLNLIAANSREYKLAQWINEGTFYLVSTKHTAEEKIAEGSKPTIDAFVATGNASRAFRHLAKNTWKWGEYAAETEASSITYESGVADVRKNLLSSGTSENAYDYYLVAEPVLTNAKAKLGDSLHVIYDLQAEFAAANDGAKIPAAGLFVSNKAYASKKAEIDVFLSETAKRVENVYTTPAVAAESLKQYAAIEGNDVSARFGIGPALVTSVNSSYLPSSRVADNKAVADGFNTILGGQAFASSLFPH